MIETLPTAPRKKPTDWENDVLSQCMNLNFRKVTRQLTKAYDDAFRPLGIRVTQFSVLSAIALGQGLTLDEMADKLSLERTTFIKNLAPLKQSGYVFVDKLGKGAAKTAVLTKEGRTLFRRAYRVWLVTHREIRKMLPETKWDDLFSNFRELETHLVTK